jgi:hypothetical protein
MFRLKTIFGDGMASRSPARQATEAGIRCRALNIMTHQGMPKSERVVARSHGRVAGIDALDHLLPSCNYAVRWDELGGDH